MQVAVIGAGYVGLTTATCLAEIGHSIECVDIDATRVEALKQGKVPIHEPDLEHLMRRNLAAGRLRFSDDMIAATKEAEIVIIAVGTPKAAGGEADLSFVKSVARQLASCIRPKTVIAVKSTVGPGTARLIREVIAERRRDLDFWVTSNPEFLREGSAVEDFFMPDRIVIGADDPDAAARLAELYRPLLERGVPSVTTSTVNAELIKYAANAFLALKVGFINDVADLCERADGDIAAVAKGIGLDSRIGSRFLRPGPGFGGSCFPKDTEAFAAAGRRFGAPQPLIETLVARNQGRKRALATKVLTELKGKSGARVAVLGVAFKADTDDVRESAALTIIPVLQDAGVKVVAHDPEATANAARLLTGVEWRDCPYEAARDADLVLILTEWNAYRVLDIARLSRVMRGATVFDCRNLMEPQEVAAHGLRYVSLGRAAAPRSSTTASMSKASKRQDRRVASPSHL